jgi:GTP1/Obg family GTP-binding protein
MSAVESQESDEKRIVVGKESVGKSELVAGLSGARPRIGPSPWGAGC